MFHTGPSQDCGLAYMLHDADWDRLALCELTSPEALRQEEGLTSAWLVLSLAQPCSSPVWGQAAFEDIAEVWRCRLSGAESA